jgi:transaldolase
MKTQGSFHGKMRQCLWHDGIPPELLELSPGQFGQMNRFQGLIFNPSSLREAILSQASYQQRVKRLHAGGMQPTDIGSELAFEDAANAGKLLLAHYQESEGKSGFVCLPVDPRLANDADQIIEEARHISQICLVKNFPNYMVTVPATEAGIVAMWTLFDEGVNVHATLAYTASQVAEIAGLHGELCQAPCVISVLVDPWNGAVDPKLTNGFSPGLGRTGVAMAKRVYSSYTRVKAKLGTQGVQDTARLLFTALPKVSGKAFDRTRDMSGLIGCDNILAVCPETQAMFVDADFSQATVQLGMSQAEQLFEVLPLAGVNVQDTAAQLLAEGVQQQITAQVELEEVISNQA